MGTTQPIRNRKELQKFSTYYQTVKPHPRNYALIILGLNTALRISDLLQLQWSDVYDFYTQRFREHLLILEQKTGKQNYIALNKNAKNALRWYMDACFPQECDYLFCKNTRPAASHQPFAGIPHCKRSRSPNYKQPHGQLSLHAENVWLPRMETGGTACTAYGFVQSLFL